MVLGGLDRPLAEVELRVAGTESTARTDSAGRFSLSGLPAGTRMLMARRVGYSVARAAVELRNGRDVSQRLHLTRIVSLDSIRIVAQRTNYDVFEERRRDLASWGKFLDAEQIMAKSPFDVSDLFKSQLGFTLVNGGIMSTRGGGVYSALHNDTVCPTNVVIDEIQAMGPWLDHLDPNNIAGIEIYRSSAGAPPQYDAHCGVIVVWTKRGRGE